MDMDIFINENNNICCSAVCYWTLLVEYFSLCELYKKSGHCGQLVSRAHEGPNLWL